MHLTPLHRRQRHLRSASTSLDRELLVEVRRDLHAHPELAWPETRTTELVADRLATRASKVQLLPSTGWSPSSAPATGPVVALRADLDALPVEDRTEDPWAQHGRRRRPRLRPRRAHRRAARRRARAGRGAAGAPVPGRVRLLFQPAEEVMPGGALEMHRRGRARRRRPRLRAALRPVARRRAGSGCASDRSPAPPTHIDGAAVGTRRPHLAAPPDPGPHLRPRPPGHRAAGGAVSRRLDPRAGASMVWGMVRAGSAPNVIPVLRRGGRHPADARRRGVGRGRGPGARAIDQIVAPYGVEAEVDYVRGVPPVVNEPGPPRCSPTRSSRCWGGRRRRAPRRASAARTSAWYLETVPGRDGPARHPHPGGPTYDLHQGDLRIDERAVPIGARVMAIVAYETLDQARPAHHRLIRSRWSSPSRPARARGDLDVRSLRIAARSPKGFGWSSLSRPARAVMISMSARFASLLGHRGAAPGRASLNPVTLSVVEVRAPGRASKPRDLWTKTGPKKTSENLP